MAWKMSPAGGGGSLQRQGVNEAKGTLREAERSLRRGISVSLVC